LCELQEARNLGYTYFQGYFFCKPSMLSGRDIPAVRSTCLRLLEECSAPELDYDKVERIFNQEPSLTYRQLRFLNSPPLPFRAEIHSVRHASACWASGSSGVGLPSSPW